MKIVDCTGPPTFHNDYVLQLNPDSIWLPKFKDTKEGVGNIYQCVTPMVGL